MHPWLSEFAAYISKQLSVPDNVLRESLHIVQTLKERYDVNLIDDVIKHLSAFSFGNIAQLTSGNHCHINDLTFCQDQVDDDKPHMVQSAVTDDEKTLLLVCRVAPNENAKNGSICLQDSSGKITCLIDDLDFTHMNNGVLLIKWRFISYRKITSKCKVKKERLKYVEVYDCIPCLLKEEEEPLLVSTIYHHVSDYLMLHRKDKEFNLEGVVLTKSPVHKITGSNPFYFLRLVCKLREEHTTVVVVQGNDKVHWNNLTKIGSYIKLTELRLSIVNKGTADERKVLCTTKSSKMTKIKGFDTSFNKTDDYLINYMGSVTSCEDAEYGLYCLDDKIKLLCSHQPSLKLGQGLRNGARVYVTNVHKLQWLNQVVLFCCTISSIEIIKLSESSSLFQPFIAQLHPLPSKCQRLQVKEYLWLVDSTKRVFKTFSKLCVSSKEFDRVCTILYNLLNLKELTKRSVFSEFIDLPHKCIFHHSLASSHLPTFASINGVISLMDSIYTTEWFNGREFDQCGDTDDCKWQYSIHEHKNIVFCGVALHDHFSFKLRDDQQFLRLISISKIGEEDMLLLKNLKIVVEKFNFYEMNSLNNKKQEKVFFKRYLLIDEGGFNVLLHENNHTGVGQETKKIKLTEQNDHRCLRDLDGIVMSREIKRSRTQNYDVERHANDVIYVPSIGKVKMATLINENRSFYPFTTSVLIVRIFDSVNKEVFSVYFDSNKLKYPIGILPGASVKFTRVEEIKSRGGSSYFKMSLSSTMEITRLPPASFDDLKIYLGNIQEKIHECTTEKRVISFCKMDQSFTSKKFYILSRVVLVQSVFAKWKCGRCFHDVIEGHCRHHCLNKHFFTLEMRCVVDDGTAEGYIVIEKDNVRQILNLSSLDYGEIKTTSHQFGCISYQRSLEEKNENAISSPMPKKTECELLLQKKVFVHSVYRYRRFYCKLIPRNPGTEQKSSIIVCGQTQYQTLSPPKVWFQCISLTDVNFVYYNKKYTYLDYDGDKV